MKRIPFRLLLPTLILPLLFLASCKKDKGKEPTEPEPTPPTQPQELSDADSLKYLMYNTMQLSFVDGGRDTSDFDLPTYYWYQSVPKINPLDAQYADAKSLLEKMKTYAIDPATGAPYDRYSFLDNGQVAGEIQQGVAGDLGMQVSYAYAANRKDILLVVLFTDKNSPAGLAGVNRGWLITSVNGIPVKYDGPDGTNVNNAIKAIFDDDQASFVFKKPDGTTQSNTLSKSTYDINPVLFDSVYNIAGKKVGYFVFNTFSNITYNNAPTLTRTEIDRVFTKFASANISDLVVDLRYNGGGAIPTMEYLDSKIAPASVAGKEMYHYLYNDKLEANKTDVGLESKVMFQNGGNLNLDKVYFITSRNTASASELTINNLEPYMSVQRVGDTSYGKPVGFITFHLSIFKGGVEKDLADLYAINFETLNANNEGQYYQGLVPDEAAADYIGTPWGQPGDENLEKIFNYIATGSYGRYLPGTEIRRTGRQSIIPIKGTMRSLRFNGMVNDKMGKQIQTYMRKKKAESNR